MARKIYWCDNCGYEIRGGGRCPGCGERLLASPLPELETGDPDEEVEYGLGRWNNRARGRLIEALINANVRHRFEGEELVVRASDEAEVDDLTAAVMARKIWWCRNCGYEGINQGQCEDCGEDLIASPLPELEAVDGSEEVSVSYSLADWDNQTLVRLIEALIAEGVLHRFAGQDGDRELVVGAADQPIVTRITEAVLATANRQRPARRHKDLSPGGLASQAAGNATAFDTSREQAQLPDPDGQPAPPTVEKADGQAAVVKEEVASNDWSRAPLVEDGNGANLTCPTCKREFAPGHVPASCPRCGRAFTDAERAGALPSAPRQASAKSLPASVAESYYNFEYDRLTRRPWRGKAWVIVGAFAMFFAILDLWVPGVIFNSSVSQVSGLCSGVLGAYFKRANPRSCDEASALLWVGWLVFFFGIGGLVRGAWRWYREPGGNPAR